MTVLFVMMRGIRRHYDRSPASWSPPTTTRPCPSRVHAIVLVSKVHKPTLRALAYARASRPYCLEAVTVNVDEEVTRRTCTRSGTGAASRSRCKVLDSPYREITRPILDYVRDIRRRSPRDVVMVYIPEYVVGRWWEQILHNQSALRLKGRLLFTPGRHGDVACRTSCTRRRRRSSGPSATGRASSIRRGPRTPRKKP